ncbi:MAG TPA: hypothetical protein DDX92_08435 [Flavobacteriales bacterium]|jgi:hypothetical protein|nr:hypothetical protein [Flavobacteriales bacterium]
MTNGSTIACLVFFVMAFFTGRSILAQDLIVTTEYDSIHCEIQKVTSDEIYYKEAMNGQMVKKAIPLYRVAAYMYDFGKPENTVRPDANAGNSRDLYDPSRFRFGASVGYGYSTSTVPQSANEFEREYLNELKSSYSLWAEAGYVFSESIAANLIYSYFNTSNYRDLVQYLNNQNQVIHTGPLSDDITIHYIGAEFVYRYGVIGPDDAIWLGLSFGYVDYRNNFIYDVTGTQRGFTLGSAFRAGFDYKVDEWLGLGISLGLMSGSLSSVTVETASGTQTFDLVGDGRIAVGRFDASIGLRFFIR